MPEDSSEYENINGYKKKQKTKEKHTIGRGVATEEEMPNRKTERIVLRAAEI